MAAVCIDDAWGESLVVPPPPRPQSPRPPTEAKTSTRARRALVDGDVVTTPDPMALLVAEMKEWQRAYAEQQRTQKTVLYAAIAIVVLLLVFVAHAYARLQYATDCLVAVRR